MDEPLETLRRVAETIPLPSPDMEGVRRKARRRSARRKIKAGGVALLVAAAGFAFVVGALRDAGPQPATPATQGDLDPSTLAYAWSVEVEGSSDVGEVLQDADRIYVPTATGAVAYPKACSDPCQPAWSLEVVVAGPEVGQPWTQLALEDGLLAVEVGGRLAVVNTDCGSGGAMCGPLWYADPIAGTSGYVGPVITDGVVKVTTNEGDAPDNRHTAFAFEVRCRDDGGECTPIWRSELGSGAAHVPGVAVDGVFYQQVGTRMVGFSARCRTDGGVCEPDFVVEATGDPQSQQSSLYGPVPYGGALVVAAGDGNLYGFPEHCGTSCDPLWVTPVSDYLESFPMLAGDVIVLSHDGGITAVPGSCAESSGGACAPEWHANLEGYWSVDYADEDVVVAASHFRGPRGILVLPADCTDPCEPTWTAEFDGELYGVASDGTNVYTSDGQHVLAYPVACSDPCAPIWSTELEGSAWGFLIDDSNLVVTTQTASNGFLGVGVTGFTGSPTLASEAPENVEASTADVLNLDLMPQSILENASTDLIPEWQRRVREWAAKIGAEDMSEQALVATMDILTRAITESFLANDDWLGERELMMRRTYACQLLPPDHPYRGGEYCT